VVFERYDLVNLSKIKEDLSLCFSDRVSILGLIPSSDFRHADLQGIDFSDSDLRGYDFSFADLSNSNGINIKFDESTKFYNADLASSPFELEQALREALSNDKNKRRLATLIAGDSLDKATFISNASSSSSREDKVLALSILKKDPNIFVQNTAIYSSLSLFKSQRERMSFIKAQIQDNFDKELVVFAAVNVLHSSKRLPTDAAPLIIKLIEDERTSIATCALRAFSRHYSKKSMFFEAAASSVRVSKGLSIKRISKAVGEHGQLYLRKKINGREHFSPYILSMEEEIDLKTFNRLIVADKRPRSLQEARRGGVKNNLQCYFESLYARANFMPRFSKEVLHIYWPNGFKRDALLGNIAVPDDFASYFV
jgi:hypothetical protein